MSNTLHDKYKKNTGVGAGITVPAFNEIFDIFSINIMESGSLLHFKENEVEEIREIARSVVYLTLSKLSAIFTLYLDRDQGDLKKEEDDAKPILTFVVPAMVMNAQFLFYYNLEEERLSSYNIMTETGYILGVFLKTMDEWRTSSPWFTSALSTPIDANLLN